MNKHNRISFPHLVKLVNYVCTEEFLPLLGSTIRRVIVNFIEQPTLGLSVIESRFLLISLCLKV